LPASDPQLVILPAPRLARTLGPSNARDWAPNRLEGRARKLGHAGLAAEPKQGATRLRIPPRRAKADKGRDEVKLFRRVGRGSERIHVGGRPDHLERVTQPLHRRPGDEDRAFERIGALTAELVGDGAKKTVLRRSR